MGQKYPTNAMDRRSRFPKGHYLGEISESKDDTNEDGTLGSVSFRLINNTAVEAEKEPGGRICFIRIPTFMEVKNKQGKTKTLLTSDIGPDDTEDEDFPFQLRLAVGMFLMLGVQLGVATVGDDGVEWEEDLETFIDALRDGEYNGAEVEFIVEHRQYTAKRGPNKGNVVKVEDVSFPTDSGDEEDEREAEPEPEPEAKKGRRKVAKDDGENGEGKEEEEEEEEKKPKGSGRAKFVRRRKAKSSAE